MPYVPSINLNSSIEPGSHGIPPSKCYYINGTNVFRMKEYEGLDWGNDLGSKLSVVK